MNPIVKTVLGVLVGDLIFAGSAVLFFYFSQVDPHSPAAPRFVAISLLYGIAFALLAGFVAGIIGRRVDLIAGILLAVIIAVPALISMITRPGQGAIWSQSAVVLLMAPAALVGDWLRRNRTRT